MTLRIAIMTPILALSFDAYAVPGGVHPCAKLKAQCEAAGFVEGGAKTGKGLMKNCMGPIVRGEAVPGVTVDPNDAAACKAKMAEKQSAKQGDKQPDKAAPVQP